MPGRRDQWHHPIPADRTLRMPRTPASALRAIALCLLWLPSWTAHAATGLSTHAERTGYRETGRYDEVRQLCAACARQHPARTASEGMRRRG